MIVTRQGVTAAGNRTRLKVFFDHFLFSAPAVTAGAVLFWKKLCA
jgi:hypothetical protein